MAISTTTSYINYTSTPSLPNPIPVKQLATDQLESKYNQLGPITDNTRNSYYSYIQGYNVTLSGYSPLATYAQTGASTTFAPSITYQIWKTGM